MVIKETQKPLLYERTLGMSVMEGKGFYYPNDAVVASNGKIYVLNRSLEARGSGRGMRVTICDSGDEFHGDFGQFGSGLGQFMWPSAICEGPDQKIYITDEHLHKIMIFSSDGVFLKEWGQLGLNPGDMDSPSGIAFRSEGELFVSDTYNHRIQVFTEDGEYVRSFGSSEELNLPWRISLDSAGNIYVADWGNDRICKYSTDGVLLRTFGETGSTEGKFLRPADVVADDTGKMFVGDWGNERIQVLDSDGNFLQSNMGESDLSPWAANFLNINVEEGEARQKSDLHKKDIKYANPNDRHEVSSHIEEYFWSPMSLCLTQDGRLYVVESNRHRIQIFEVLN